MADTLPQLKAEIAKAEAKYGDLPKGLLEKLAGIESAGGRNLVNPKSSARGPFQFMKDTGPEFGLKTEEDRMDFAKSTDAAARLLLRNKKDLERQIGRTATSGELYLAHQQGATGAAKLLKNPNAKAADVVGDPERIRLNGGDPATMTAGAFAAKWTSKIDGGSAPAKKQSSLGSLGALPQGITAEKDFYDFNGADMAKLEAGQAAVGRLGREPSKVNQTLADVPATPISRLSQLVTGTPEQAAERMDTPADEARPSRKDTAILAGISTLRKTAARLAEPLASIQAVEDEATAPSGIAGEFKRGVEAGLQNMSADQEYFGAIIDTIAGNEAGAKSRIFNAQQYEEYSAKALQGMQSFEEFTNAPTFDGFITQVVSAAGQVAPSAVESIASALATGGLYSLGKTALTQGGKVVAKTLVKDLVAKKAKGQALDAAEDGILDGLYKNFKTGALAGAFGSEYKMMSGSAFSEFGDAGADMNAENAVKSLLIGVPQAAIGVGGEFAILKMLGTLATKKATRSAKTSVLKKFAQEVARTGVKAGMLEGATEVGQETISVLQRNAIDPTFTMQDAQLRIGQAAFAGFFGGGLFGSAAAGPAAGISAVRSTKIIDNAKKFLKDAAEARTETEVVNETTGIDDAALGGVSTGEASSDIDAQVEVLMNPEAPKNAVFAALDPSAPPAVEPGQSHVFELEDGPHKGQKVVMGHIPGKGLIMSQDPAVVDEVLTTAEIGGDVDAAIGAAIGYVGGKDGNEVVRVKNKDGAVVDEAVTNEENKLASAERAEQIAAVTPGAQVDIVPVEQALEERNAKATLDKKEFNAEAAAARALMDTISEDEVSGDNYEAEANKKADFVTDEARSPAKNMAIDKRQDPTNDDADPETDEARSPAKNMFDAQLDAHFAEADAANAKVIFEFNERSSKNSEEQEAGHQKKIDALWKDLEDTVEDDAVMESYRKYKERMPLKMIEQLIKLNTNEGGGTPSFYDVADEALPEGGARTAPKYGDDTARGKLAITQRDPFPNAEVTVTREGVRNVLKQARKFPNKNDTGAIQMKNGKPEHAPASMFWIVNRNTKEKIRLNGTPAKGKKRGKKFGRPGLAMLAQAGQVLNARTQQGLQGDGMSELQSISQGLITMLKALSDAGYDLQVGAFPAMLKPFDQNKLEALADSEVAMMIEGKPYGINDLLDVKPPFEESKTSQKTQGDPNDERNYHEELRGNRTVKVMNGPAVLDSADPNDVREEIATVDGPDEFAKAEDLKKRLNGADAEVAANKKESKARSEQARRVVNNARAAERASRGEISAAELIEEGLDPLPDGASIVVKPVGSGFQATLSGPNIVRQTFTNKDRSMAIARAHQRAVSTSESAPIQHNTLALETVHSTQKSRDAHPEIAGVPAPKNQISIKNEGVTSPGTNKTETFGKIGVITSKILATAMAKFNFHKPVIVMTVKYLEDNFESLAGPGKRFEGGRKFLIAAIDEMTNPNLPQNPARFLPGVNQHLILLRDDADVSLDINGDRIIAYDDAEIGATLAHELGHIVFKQEFESMSSDDPLRQALWKAYVADVKAMKADGTTDTGQYTNDKHGFEEWYSDQLMAFVYRKAQSVPKGLVAGYFTRVAKAITDFFKEVNKALGGRLKSSFQKVDGIVVQDDKGNKKTGNVTDYFDAVSKKNQEKRRISVNNAKELAAQEIKATEAAARAAAEAAAVEEALKLAREDDLFRVDEDMQIKNMFLNLQNRIPAGAQQRMATAGRAIMSSGTWGNLGTKIKNIAYASTDFMGATEHGPAGKALKTFFGTLSQSTDKLGWNKRELFAQNLWNNKLADIFGFNDKTNPKEWDSQATRDIMIEAMDEDIDDANLSTQQAKDIRKLYKDIETKYLKKPGGIRAGYYVPNFKPRKNYGGPRMWNIDKISKNEAAFVAWLATKLRQTGNPTQRAQDIFDTMVNRTKNQVDLIERQVEQDFQALGITNPTPVQRAAMEFRESMRDQAVMEMRDKILREIRRGRVASAGVIAELLTADPTNTDLTALAALPVEQQPDGLKKFWMRSTEKIRLTPGMDPALRRELAPEVKTLDAYNADPSDPNGWLLPPSLAHAQYMHYIARRVEFEKMGIERGGRTGAEYIISQLDAIPDQHRMNVDAAIMANLGKFGENMSNGWRTVNSVASVLTVFTTLLFTTLTSLTDPAGIFVRMKEFNSLGTYINGLKTALTTREFQELARSVGVVTGRTQEHMMIGQGELDYANQTARRMTDAFFRYTGLEWYTKFMRSFAVGMGREFVINTALKQDFDARDERHLAEVGLTRDDVRNWLDQYQMFNTPHGEKVRAAIARFADEAIIRPDASQRPTWASNPYLQMVWHLKSYYYGFGKTVLGGLGREMKNRYTEDGNFNGVAQSALLYAGTIIPLTMMGMASRDWLKWLFQLAIPGVDETASASMKLDTTGYMWEIFKRSGTMGPFALGLTTMEAFKFEGIAAPFTANVPMFDLFDDTIFDGDLSRPLPVINNIK